MTHPPLQLTRNNFSKIFYEILQWFEIFQRKALYKYLLLLLLFYYYSIINVLSVLYGQCSYQQIQLFNHTLALHQGGILWFEVALLIEKRVDYLLKIGRFLTEMYNLNIFSVSGGGSSLPPPPDEINQ